MEEGMEGSNTDNLKDFINAARGDVKADLLLKNARIADVFSGDVFEDSVAIYDGRIIGLASMMPRKSLT